MFRVLGFIFIYLAIINRKFFFYINRTTTTTTKATTTGPCIYDQNKYNPLTGNLCVYFMYYIYK